MLLKYAYNNSRFFVAIGTIKLVLVINRIYEIEILCMRLFICIEKKGDL